MAIHHITSGQNPQFYLDTAESGDVLFFETGSVFEGVFEIKNQRNLTLKGITALISKVSSQPVIKTIGPVRDINFFDLNFQGAGVSDIVRMGHINQSREDVSTNLLFHNCEFIGHESGCQRGITINSGTTVIRKCRFKNIKAKGVESQCIAGWNGPGPFLIEDNYLETGSIGILFGGIQPSINALVPSNIIVRNNYVTRDLSLKGEGYAVKNLFELKNAQNVIVRENLFENNWLDGQNGYAILFTVRASGPDSPWSVVENVDFRYNLVRNSGGGINILGYDSNNPSKQANNINVESNIFANIDKTEFGGHGAFLQMVNEPKNIRVVNNAVYNDGFAIMIDSGPANDRRPIHEFVFKNNSVFGEIWGRGTGTGQRTIDTYLPNSIFEGNQFLKEYTK